MLHGSLHPDFAAVGVSLARILPRRGPGGAAVCVYHRGEKVVDIWGGTRDAAGNPWQEDTLSVSFSTTKGVASTLLHVFADRGADRLRRARRRLLARVRAGRQGRDHGAPPALPRGGPVRDRRRGRARERDARLGADGPPPRRGHAAPRARRRARLSRAHLRLARRRARAARRGDEADQRAVRDRARRAARARRALLRRARGSAAPLRAAVRAPVRRPDRAAAREHRADHRARAALAPPARRGRRRAAIRPRRSRRSLPPGMDELDFDGEPLRSASIPAANGMFTARSLARLYACLAAGGELDGVRLLSAEGVRRATASRTAASGA